MENEILQSHRCLQQGIKISSQLGMLMPDGMPLPANVSTSREVKSGLRNWSFSKAAGHGSSGSSTSALLTSSAKRALIALFTTATNPATQGPHKWRKPFKTPTPTEKMNTVVSSRETQSLFQFFTFKLPSGAKWISVALDKANVTKHTINIC